MHRACPHIFSEKKTLLRQMAVQEVRHMSYDVSNSPSACPVEPDTPPASTGRALRESVSGQRACARAARNNRRRDWTRVLCANNAWQGAPPSARSRRLSSTTVEAKLLFFPRESAIVGARIIPTRPTNIGKHPRW